MPLTPEQRAREEIDRQLEQAGWVVQDRDEANLTAARGVAIREFRMATGHGNADYLLFVDGRALGALEAKPAGVTLSGVEPQGTMYSEGLPDVLEAPVRPLPFIYLSTGAETRFFNGLDPEPRSRRLFTVHRPETLAEWVAGESLTEWGRTAERLVAERPADYLTRPSTLRSRLRTMPPVELPGMWPNQIEAVTNLEQSFAEDRPRALLQMATGSGKTFTAVASIYRLIKFGGARRVLFLVDRSNLGEQAEREFKNYITPDDHRKFDELYNVEFLRGNTIGPSTKVVITTIQRLYSMLRGEPELEEEAEERSHFEIDGHEGEAALDDSTIAYNPAIPPEFFDIVFIDECHRSIYTLWRQVLEYFDAYLVGLTATPAKHTFGFFNRNLVMEYSHERAVADHVNVDFDIYRIRTQITEQGATIEAERGVTVGMRDRRTREVRWEQPDEDVSYSASELDRAVVAKDQIRTIIRTYRDQLPIDIFPDRTEVPKTLIFAKDDSHAEDIVEIVREEFAKGNDFCQKITYKTTGAKPKDLIQQFRMSYNPRIAVTVDMIATGTDIKPVEVVMFMRTVKSRVLFEQMKGRGVRIATPTEMRDATPDAKAKTHFVIVDAVGVTETELNDTQPLEKNHGVSLRSLMEHVGMGGTDPDMLSSVASRLARLDKQCGPDEVRRVADAGDGVSLGEISGAIVDALDPDFQFEVARRQFNVPDGQAPTPEQIEEATKALLKQAVNPLASNAPLRGLIQDLKKQFEQVIDEVSQDELLHAGMSEEARDRDRELVQSFESYLEEHRDELDALQFFYSQPYGSRLRYEDIRALADAIGAPPRSWTPERLWRAYAALEADRVRGASAQRILTDIVSLVRFALKRDETLSPYAEQVRDRFANWLEQQRSTGRAFTSDQEQWLEMMRDHIATSVEIRSDDFTSTPFAQHGGLFRAMQVFGGQSELGAVIDELNLVLAA